MKKIYHLSTCNTCQKILKEIKPEKNVELQNIKEDKITEKQLDEMHVLAGSYDSLFSRRSVKFRLWNLQDKELSETDKRELILKEYTFLKRPVMISDKAIFIGNAKATVDAAKKVFKK